MNWPMVALLALSAGLAQAQGLPWAGADVLVLGEVHDNPDHHAEQARIVAAVNPTVLVFEMLSPADASAAIPALRSDPALLAQALGWAESGWPDFAMYYPIFAAAPAAAIMGAEVADDDVTLAVLEGAAQAFGPGAPAYGLGPLDPVEQDRREAELLEAHCGALPADMLPGMVAVQRLRDAQFARVVLDGLERFGGPVVLITGTGHARADTGVPAVLALVRPDVQVWSLGQMESATRDATADAPFDAVNVTAPVERPDPCLAFQ